MAQEDNSKRIEEAKKLSKEHPAKAEKIYQDILSKPPGSNDKAVRDFENALMGLGELYRDHKRTHDLATLIQQTRDVLTSFARAKTAKLGMSITYTCACMNNTNMIFPSPTTPRPLHRHPQHPRHPSVRNEILH